MSLVGPSGDGICNTDAITITGGASNVPVICGENSGQHVIVDFDNGNPILITIAATSTYTFGRHWFIRATQINCDALNRGIHKQLHTFNEIAYSIWFFLSSAAPSGCLQYHLSESGIVRSFNYSPSPNSQPNSIGVEGSRQVANLAYGICFKVISSCSITYSVLTSDVYSFTLTGDVGAVDPAILSTSTLQEQTCTTDYVIIPNPSQNGTALNSGSDRFCGLGLGATTSKHKNTISSENLPIYSYFFVTYRHYHAVYAVCCHRCK